MAATPNKHPLKFLPPCWIQEEALSLIEAYRERWYELCRGYYRTADWDAVAATVGIHCPRAFPSKTSTQSTTDGRQSGDSEVLCQVVRQKKERQLRVEIYGGGGGGDACGFRHQVLPQDLGRYSHRLSQDLRGRGGGGEAVASFQTIAPFFAFAYYEIKWIC
ncbi:hypothetical protein RJ640_016364 [Escallonia rubra]|uniref:Uncharacterized protein n=1 Tax=Escallonia rubra TaxID=112253 RepID=A0AA88RE14_9ASTE|nr:hypothetical protein RJ640_016364 [Escallonia rubra]